MKQAHYLRLLDDLKNQIITGHFRMGDLLPSENELSDLYTINRATVRHALEELVKQGYIEKRQGKGSIVLGSQRSLGLLSVRGFSQIAGEIGDPVRSVFIKKPHFTEWDSAFIFILPAIEKQAKCIAMKRIRYIGYDPVMLEQTWLPDIGLPGFTKKEFINNSLFETLNKRYLLEIKHVDQEIRAAVADKPASKNLYIKKGSPVLILQLKFSTSNPDLHVYSRLICNTEKYPIGNLS
jgi:DNA-binding GntR family transcriptional regulator